jgi:hypothetical protein
MFETIACSSKLVDPMIIVGLVPEALTDAKAALGTQTAAATAASAPRRRERLNRMGDTFSIWEGRKQIPLGGDATELKCDRRVAEIVTSSIGFVN